jgi:YD repeat-containing protein
VFSYDGESRMTGANVANTGAVQYVYDGSGRRVEKIAGGTTTIYVYDAQGRLAAEYSNVANPVAGTEYLTADPLGSTRLVTNAAGAVLKRYDYVPFGEDPAGLEKFGGARQVESIPPELEIVQRGQNANHFEIAPRQPMTLQRFQELLNQVKLK